MVEIDGKKYIIPKGCMLVKYCGKFMFKDLSKDRFLDLEEFEVKE